jgi:hypothetical protein
VNVRILILDIVHGGEILAEEYLKMGHSVDCVDVYGTAKEDTVSRLRRIGASVRREVPKEHYEKLIMPVHCPD